MPIFNPWVTWTLLNYVCHSHSWSFWPHQPSVVLLFAGYTRSWKMRGSHARKFEILDPGNGLFGKKNATCNVCFPLWRYKTFFLPFPQDPNNPANNLLFAGLNKVRDALKKNSKMNDIKHLSNYPLPPCPKNDIWKNDKSQQSMDPSLLEERMTN